MFTCKFVFCGTTAIAYYKQCDSNKEQWPKREGKSSSDYQQ